MRSATIRTNVIAFGFICVAAAWVLLIKCLFSPTPGNGWTFVLILNAFEILAGITYLVLALVLGGLAIRHRGTGWTAGVLIALLLLTLPVWTLGSFAAFEAFGWF